MLLTLLTGLWFACHKEIEPGCDTQAMVTDLSKTGGCGFGFRLTDGTVLTAEQHTTGCGHHQNPLANFQLVDSMKVKIGYELEHHHDSSCKTGTVVEITCIEQAPPAEKKPDFPEGL